MAKSDPVVLKLSGEGMLGSSYRLELGGKDISARVTGVTVNLNVAEVNQAEIRYLCDVIEIEGEFKVTHRCPLGDE